MFSLKLFGGATIEGPTGPLVGRVAQRRRLALLAVLSVGRQRPVSRDKLLTLFWPETDSERARHSLAESLYQIRKELGEDGVLSIGEDVALNPDIVRSDVAEFEQAVERGDLQVAARVYAGPFLEGFHVSGASEFEHWLDGERERLSRVYGSTLLELVREAEADGNADEAVEWLRRLAAQDPYDSRVALRLMEALASGGDRGGALRHARVHTRLLHEELQAEPDAQVLAFAERLRSEAVHTVPSQPDGRDPAHEEPRIATPPPINGEWQTGRPAAGEADRRPAEGSRRSSSTIPQRSMARHLTWKAAGWITAAVIGSAVIMPALGGLRPNAKADQDSSSTTGDNTWKAIAVLPFENLTGLEEDDAFTNGIHSDLITALSRVRAMTVISRAAVLPYQDRTTSRQRIAEDLAVDVLLEGGVQRSGQRVRINVQLSDATTGQLLWGESYSQDLTVSNLFAIQSMITERIVALLEASITEADRKRLVTPPTENLTAYEYFHKASQAFDGTRAGNLEEARLLRLALAADSGHAPAWARLAATYAWRTSLGFAPSVWDSTQVFAHRALDLDPNDADAHVALGVMYWFQGRLEEGERAVRTALELDPNHALAVRRLGELYRERGAFADALEYHLASLRLAPNMLSYRTWIGMTHAHLGDYETAERWYQSVLTLDPNYLTALEGMAFLHLFRAQADSADHYGERIAAAHAHEPRGLATAAAIGHYLRDFERVRRHAGRAISLADAGAPVRHGVGAGYGTLATTLLGFAYWQVGDSARANVLFEESLSFLNDMVSRGADTPRWPYEIGLIKMARGDTTGAIAELESAYERGFRWTWMLELEPMLDPLRMHPRFQRLVERVRVDVSAMRRTVDRNQRDALSNRS
jgi:DNA-binding SARP family transcriptional activator/TolB-like protein/Tfp pilus assembly protein PilF